MVRNRIKYPGALINNRDPEKHFQFFDVQMRDYYMSVLKTLSKYKEIDGKALHIGCGPGAFEILYCDRTEYAKITGLERSRTLLKIGEAVLSRFGYNDRILIKFWDGESLPFDDNEFDFVISLLSLHQWKNLENTFREIERVRKRDSVVFISDFRRDRAYFPFYINSRKYKSFYGREITLNLRNAFKSSYTSDEISEVTGKLSANGWSIQKNDRWLEIVSRYSHKTESDESESSDNNKTTDISKGEEIK